MDGRSALLSDRGVVSVAGAAARRFLHDLATSDVEGLAPGQARFAALLSPQGKILYDFFVFCEADDAFLLDAPAAKVAELVKRLIFYRLRAKADVVDRSDEMGVGAVWGGARADVEAFVDPRLDELGARVLASKAVLAGFADAAEDWRANRIGLGVPEGGSDFPFGDAFPHEACMDQLNGVDFNKGCYVGQEVVSRMQHRGTARTRIVPVRLDGAAEQGMEIFAGDLSIGRLGGVAGERALAMIRLDRAADAIAEGRPITAGGAALKLIKPAWARFAFPGDPATAP